MTKAGRIYRCVGGGAVSEGSQCGAWEVWQQVKDWASRVQDMDDDCCRTLVEQSTHAYVMISLFSLKSSTSVALVEPTNTLICSVLVGDCCDLTFEGQVSRPCLFLLIVLLSCAGLSSVPRALVVCRIGLLVVFLFLICILRVLSFAFILQTFHSRFSTSWSLHHSTLMVSLYNLAVIHSFFPQS